MSDSSEEEDLSRFKEAVDLTFLKLIDESKDKSWQCAKTGQTHSERHLEESSHYNDVRVPKEMQRHIGDKISAIISDLVEYVDIEQKNVKKQKIKGGVRLFNDSEGLLSCEEVKDTSTEAHNSISKKIKLKQKKRVIDLDVSQSSESDKIKAAVVTAEYVMSKKEVQPWVSRRKQKVFPYKASEKNKNILIEIPRPNVH